MKVLVIDDSKMIKLLVKDLLMTLGHEFFEAENGKVGLEMVEKIKPDLILLDYNMPIMDGPGFLQEYKMVRGGKIHVIMMTTESANDKIMETLKLGASEYMMKPFDKDILEGKIQQVLSI
jgi:two-component system chemotaxis response regulator CheY